MKNFKKTLSLAMATVLTTSAVIGGVPAEKVQAATDAKLTVTLSTKATAAVAKSLKGKNKTLALKPTVNGKAITATKVTYKSSKTGIATVSKKGVVTTKKAGKSTITMSYKKGSKTYTAKVKLTVKPVAATKLKLSKTTKTLKKGATVTLKATLSPSNTTDVTSDVKWTTSKKSVVTVKNGKIKGVKPGTATITATLGKLTKKCVVTVTNPAQKISLNQSKVSLKPGETYTLEATVKPKTTTDKAKFTTSNKSVCKVNQKSGLLRAVAPGSATITVKAGAVTKTCKVTVEKVSTVAVENVTVTPASAEVQKGETVQLSAAVSPSDANQSVTWASKNESVATVDANGLVTGVAGGVTTVTATANNGILGYAIISVKDKDAQYDDSVIVTDFVVPSEVQVGVGLSQTITPKDIVTNPLNRGDAVKFTWLSSNSAIATVEDGKIVGVSEGTATITVIGGTLSKSITVTVAEGSKAVQQGSQASLSLSKEDLDKIESFTTNIAGINIAITPEDINADCSTLKELTNQKWDNDVFYDALYSLKTKDEEGNSKFQSIASFVEITTKDADNVSVVDEKKVELADIDCSGWWVAHTAGVEVGDAGLDISYKGTTYEDASSNWNTPLYVVYTADEPYSGEGAISDTAGYSEYFVGRADVWGWTPSDNPASQDVLPDTEKVYPDDWEAWLNEFKTGKKGDLVARYDGDKLVVTFKNNGVISTTYITVDKTKPVYISLTGELCKITDIVATQRTYKTVDSAQVAKTITKVDPINGNKDYDGLVTKAADSLTISVKGSGQDQLLENIKVKAETGNEAEHVVEFDMKGNHLEAHVGKDGSSLDLIAVAEKYGIKAPILHFVNNDTTFELEGNQDALESMGLGSLLGNLATTAKK